MTGFLLDTNFVSEIQKTRPNGNVARWFRDALEEQMYISVLTLGEIRKGIASLAEGRKRADLERWLDGTLRPGFGQRILPVNEAIAERWGALTGEARRTGRSISAVDGLLAATAIEHDLTLVTRNVRDFTSTSVSVFSPWEP